MTLMMILTFALLLLTLRNGQVFRIYMNFSHEITYTIRYC